MPIARYNKKTQTAPSDTPNKNGTQQEWHPLMQSENNGTLQQWHMTNTYNDTNKKWCLQK